MSTSTELDNKKYVRSIVNTRDGYLSINLPYELCKELNLKPRQYMAVYKTEHDKIVIEGVDL